MQLRFDGRTAIVTGAARGLGREFALELAARGAAVVLNDLVDPQPVVEDICGAGGSAIAVVGSIADADTAEQCIAQALSAFGSADIIINNAAMLVLKTFTETSAGELMRTLEVNVRGPWLLAQQAWPHMAARQHGRILMVSSMNGVAFATDKHAAYGASKGALAALTRELALEGAAVGVQVNALLPGAVTGMLNTVTAPDGTGYTSPDIDLRPALVAPVAAWLVHEECTDTGLLINASSGRAAKLVTSISHGLQTPPDAFTLETVSRWWGRVLDDDDLSEIGAVSDYNDYRTKRYREVVG
jgi:NAD(P)-dependent dehydrogenase (short-subunit alcohol dehydrogenase family)